VSLSGIVGFVLAAVALLGSPGPGISALVAVGRSFQPAAALRFYGSMQLGLGIAAGVSALGLVTVISASPGLQMLLMAAATVYLLYLAWIVASAPVGGAAIGDLHAGSLTNRGAFFLGAANPKAYLAFASLYGSFTLLPSASMLAEGVMKWSICVAVMILVDFAWLALGMGLGKVSLSPSAERAFNIVMGLTIVAACAGAWL
jgi:threonine/homoserine/homoserine lactone efflux protein